MFKPELLSPAGSLEKLKVAINYGADAVYLGGLKFGLRSAAENFTAKELQEGVAYAHARGRLVYVVLNGFLHDEDLEELPDFVRQLEEQKVDAVIVSDLGVIETVKANSNIPVHLSTQASCVNVESAKFWKSIGVTRIVLGREVSLEEAAKIKREAGVEIEMFIHGSMCMAYSGNCVISNFTQGRDSNRGGCAHSCRFEYSLETTDHKGEKKTAFFMSSKDLRGLELLPKFAEYEIDSLKVEGRMKSQLYAAVMSKTYSNAIGDLVAGTINQNKLEQYATDLEKVSHRSYTRASLEEKADRDSIFDERETASDNEYVVVGSIVASKANEYILIEVRNAFNHGDELEVLTYRGADQKIKCEWIKDILGNDIERTRPSTLVRVPYIELVSVGNIVRMRSL